MLKRAVLILLALAALSGMAAAQTEGGLMLWSTDTRPRFASAVQTLAQNFEAASGVNVEVVFAEPDAMMTLMETNRAVENLPDVIYHPAEYSSVWGQSGVLDTAAATRLIDELGAEQFGALGLVGDGSGGYLSVPVDGWGAVLIYRRDVFEASGLRPPTDYPTILAAAQLLHSESRPFYGFVTISDPANILMQQMYEQFALANGNRLLTAEGGIGFNTPEMLASLRLYSDLNNIYGPPGIVDLATARSLYMDGQAAMLLAPVSVLDELAGVRPNALPNCPECADNPAFLTPVSGIVPLFGGTVNTRAGDPLPYGYIDVLSIAANADPAAADLVRYWLNDGYPAWLSVAPEAMLPMRFGTVDAPTQFVDAWRDLPLDGEQALSDFYDAETLNGLAETARSYTRWGLAEGQGALIAQMYRELTLPVILSDVLTGLVSADEGAAELQFILEDMQAALVDAQP